MIRGRGGEGGRGQRRKIKEIQNFNIINFSKVDKEGEGGGNAYPPKVDNFPFFLETFPYCTMILAFWMYVIVKLLS